MSAIVRLPRAVMDLVSNCRKTFLNEDSEGRSLSTLDRLTAA